MKRKIAGMAAMVALVGTMVTQKASAVAVVVPAPTDTYDYSTLVTYLTGELGNVISLGIGVGAFAWVTLYSWRKLKTAAA
jgi:hypothetical protein